MQKLLLLTIFLISSVSLGLSQTDGCAGAPPLGPTQINCTGAPGYVSGTTVGASTLDGINFGCINGTTVNGQWIRFTAAGPDIEIMDQSGHGAANAPYVAILDDNCGALGPTLLCQQLPILDVDGEGDDLLTTGNSYVIWIGFQGGDNTWSVCITNPAAPSNDECLNFIDVTGNLECMTGSSASVTGTTEFAGPDGFDVGGCIDAGTNSWEGVWYRFTAQGNDILIDDVAGNSPYVVILDDCNIGTANVLVCAQTPLDLTSADNGDNLLTIGQQYYVWVGFNSQNEDDFELCFDNPVPPANDECAAAINIQANIHCAIEGNASIQGTTYGAQPDNFDYSCLAAGSNGWEGIWYTFTIEGHDLMIDASGPEDPHIVLVDGCTGAELYCGQTPVDLNTANNIFDLNQYQTPIDVWMWVGFDGGLDEDFEICVDNPPPPPNDQCDNAIDITNMLNCPTNPNATVLGTTNFSTNFFNYAPLDGPNCFDPMVDEVVWYRFTAPGVDFEIEDLMGNNPSFAILTYNQCMNGAQLITCDEMPYSFDSDPDDLFNVGQEYIMMIAFPGGWQATDSFELCINIPQPPDNDLCENATLLGPDFLDCPDIPRTVQGHTTNASQDNTYWMNFDPFVDLPCMLDTTEDDGVWYQFTAIGSDIEIEDDLGNNPTIVLMRYNGCADTANVIFCEQTPISSDFGEVGNNATTPGENYLMYVTFQGGESEADTFELCIDNEGICDSEPPPYFWCQTTPICGLSALDAYCLSMVANPTGETWPGCANSIDNPNWFSFVAGASNLTIEIQVGDCVNGNGIQIAMWELPCEEDLGPNQPPCTVAELGPSLTGCATVSTAQVSGTVVTFNAATEFGHIYAILIDGWGPALCQIEINVVAGADPPVLDGQLEEPEWDDSLFPFDSDTVCAGAEDVEFSLDGEVEGACRYNWSINGDTIPGATNTNQEFIDFPTPGVFDVCVNASNFCDSTDDVCITIVVAALDPVFQYDTICEGDTYAWISTFGTPLPLDPDPSGLEGGQTVSYTEEVVNLVGCTIDETLYLHILDENDENPTYFDSVVCFQDLPFTYFNNDPIPIDPNTGVLEGHEFNRVMAHNEMCDSFFLLDLYSLYANISYATIFQPFQTNVNCLDSVITVCPDDIAANPLFTPDPTQYPDVEIHYQWFRLPDMTPVGGDSECLEVHFDDFENLNHDFEVEVTMTKGGRPAGGCLFGPFDFELDLLDFIPDSMNIIGPDTICLGLDTVYSIEQFNPTDLWPMVNSFDWDLSQFPGAVRDEIDLRNSRITFNELGTGLICVTALDPCTPSATHCKSVTVLLPPTGDPGADDEECTNTYNLQSGDNSGTWFTSNSPFGAQAPVFSDINSPSSTVTIAQKGLYTFGWITEGFGCFDTSFVDIDFIEPMSLATAIDYVCDDVHEFYTATFDFDGGIAPFVVSSSNGTLSGMSFTSDPIPAGDTVVVLITDAQGCTGSFVLSQECVCLTQGAVMNLNPIELCGEACVQIDAFTEPVLDPNDIAVYVLHTSPTDVLGTVVAENSTGEFCLTSSGAIQYDIQYYVSIVAGNELATSVDLDDRCTQIAEGQPVIWYQYPTPDAGTDDATCMKSYDLNVSNSNYSGRWVVLPGSPNVTFSDQNSPTATISTVGCGVADLLWIETNQICSDTSEIQVEFYCLPTNTTPLPECNMAQTELTFTFQLNGTGPFTETNGKGTVTGNMFEITGILLPMTAVDTLFFVDGNGCELVVPLQIADCNCIPIIAPDTVCGLSIVLESDGTGNGGSWSVVNEPSGQTATIDNPTSRMTNVTVTDYGVYRFGWTENGNLCDGYAEIDVHFVNSPEVDMSTIQYTCNNTYDGYTISFDIINGHPPSYRVFDENGLSLGQVVGTTFTTSQEIPSTQPIQILVADGFACDTFVLDLVHDCGCFTDVGDLDVTPLDLCVGDPTSVIYDATNEMADGNDVRIYILYSDVNDPINSIIDRNPTGVFNFMDPPMVVGTTYYISAVLGTESSGGQVDLTDPCLSISAPLPVTWYDAVTPEITASDSLFTCQTTQMTLMVTTTDGDINDYDIEWSTTNGNIEPGDENSQNPRINEPGTYIVTFTHKIAGCPSTANITIGKSDEFPLIVFETPMLLTCDRLQVTVSAEGSDSGPTITYSWSGPGIIGPNDGLTIDVNQPGTYTLTLTDASNGCMVSESITVGEDVTEPDANATVTQALDCSTTEVAISGQGSATGGNISYSWSVISPTGNIVGSTTGRDIVADRPGTYQIEVTNADNGCVSTASAVLAADSTVIAGANINVGQPGCDGLDDGQIIISSVIGGTAPFMYSFDGGATFGTQTGMANLGAGTYDIVITDANGCEYTETVVLVANIDFFVDLGETILIEFGDTAYLVGMTNLPDSLTQSIVWTPAIDSLNPGGLEQFMIPDLGQYSVNLTITNLNGCVEQDNVIVAVKFAEKIYIPTAMNPNSPNPENQRIYIFANPESVAAITSFEIYNRWGERMFRRDDVPANYDIDPEYAWDGMWQDELAPAGVYVYYAQVEFVTGVRKVISGEFTLLR